MISVMLFLFHLAGLQILLPVLTPLFEAQQIPFFDFGLTYPVITIFQTHKSNTVLIHCFDEIFCEWKFDMQRRLFSTIY